MDLEEQERIKQAVEDNGGPDGIVAILGSPDAESTQMFAETISLGDPTYAGALAGVSLKLPVFHVTEPEVRGTVDPRIYAEQIELMEMALDVDAIHQAARSVRERVEGTDSNE
jgi:betaine reductase